MYKFPYNIFSLEITVFTEIINYKVFCLRDAGFTKLYKNHKKSNKGKKKVKISKSKFKIFFQIRDSR